MAGEEGEPITPEPTPEGEVVAEPQTISVDALPEEFKTRTPDQIKSMWDATSKVLESRNSENEALRAQIQSLETRPPAPAPVAEPEPVDLKELLYEDPVAAFDHEFNRRFGGMEREVRQSMSDTAFMKVKDTLPDFPEYETEIRQIIDSAGGGANEATIKAAYLMARGAKSLEEQRVSANQASIERERPSPPDITPAKADLTPLQAELAKGMNMTPEEFNEYLEMDDDIEVEVPESGY